MYQTRCTGGMLVEHDDKMLHIDPGPGAMTQLHKIHYDPTRTDSIIISHAHPDHYSDAEVAVEGMTFGGWKKRGHVFGSTSVVYGDEGFSRCLSEYHMGIAGSVTAFEPGDILDVDGMTVDICTAKHSDPTNVGFKFHTPHGIVAYVSDTEFTEEIAKQYIGVRVLILPVTTPDENRIKYHLCTEDAVKFIDIVKPELAIFTHLGIVIIRRDPAKQAAMTQERTGIHTIAAEDLMTIDIGEDIEISTAQTYEGLWIPKTAPDDRKHNDRSL